MRKPRDTWMVIGIGIGQREDLSPSRCARGGFWDHETPAHGKKASTAACFVRLPGSLVPSAGHTPFEVCRLAGALVAFAAQAAVKVLHQRVRFPQIRGVKAFSELLVDCLHQL